METLVNFLKANISVWLGGNVNEGNIDVSFVETLEKTDNPAFRTFRFGWECANDFPLNDWETSDELENFRKIYYSSETPLGLVRLSYLFDDATDGIKELYEILRSLPETLESSYVGGKFETPEDGEFFGLQIGNFVFVSDEEGVVYRYWTV